LILGISKKKDVPNLLEVIRNANGILSLNENECDLIVKAINFNPFPKDTPTENIKEYLKKFAKETGISVDLHANEYTAWSNGIDATFFPTKTVEIKNLIGAGDSWDAADIVGYLAGLDSEE